MSIPDQALDESKVNDLLECIKALSETEWEELRRRIGKLDGICPSCLSNEFCACDDSRD